MELLHLSHFHHVSLVQWTNRLVPATGGSSLHLRGITHTLKLGLPVSAVSIQKYFLISILQTIYFKESKSTIFSIFLQLFWKRLKVIHSSSVLKIFFFYPRADIKLLRYFFAKAVLHVQIQQLSTGQRFAHIGEKTEYGMDKISLKNHKQFFYQAVVRIKHDFLRF